MKSAEGILKFNCIYDENNIVKSEMIYDINEIRAKLFDMNMINAYEDGIGFGNISKRLNDGKVLISGTGTGVKRKLATDGYALIDRFSITSNTVWCQGLIKASSESLSHLVIYKTLKNINYVIHAHHLKLWNNLIDKYYTTNKNIEYGSVEMALEIEKILKKITDNNNIIVMGGHKEGIIFFGEDLNKTFALIIATYNTCLM